MNKKIKTIILTILLAVLSTGAQAAVKRGAFDSNGNYIMNHQMNDKYNYCDYNYCYNPN